jgi:hypothetical protein
MTTTPKLVALGGHTLQTYASADAISTAGAVADRADRVMTWLETRLGPGPRPPLYVVGPDDWAGVALIPIYGMPHAFPDRVVVGASPAEFWNDYLATVRASDAGFVDLLVAHELTHLFHDYDTTTGQTDFPHLWLAELFANIGYYGYTAEIEPQILPALDAVADASFAMDHQRWPVTRLNDMESSLADGPLNYCWLQFLLIRIARSLWRADPAAALSKFRRTLRAPLSDDEISERIRALGGGNTQDR